MHFISIEVAAQKFLFCLCISGYNTNVTDIVQHARGVLQNIPAPVPFSHNNLHDLEFLWGVAIWMVFYNHFSKARGSKETLFKLSDVEHHLKLTLILFPPVLKSADRQNGFQTSIQETCSKLPSSKTGICVYLDGL
jgi:hypothetical protein